MTSTSKKVLDAKVINSFFKEGNQTLLPLFLVLSPGTLVASDMISHLLNTNIISLSSELLPSGAQQVLEVHILQALLSVPCKVSSSGHLRPVDLRKIVVGVCYEVGEHLLHFHVKGACIVLQKARVDAAFPSMSNTLKPPVQIAGKFHKVAVAEEYL